MAFTVADPGNLVEAATDEHEDFAFDLIAMFEIEAFALPNKWSTKSNFVEATNHIQQCMTIELQAQAEEMLEERKAKGPPVVSLVIHVDALRDHVHSDTGTDKRSNRPV